MIKVNLKFTHPLKNMWADEGNEEEQDAANSEPKADALVFDVSAFKASTKSYGGLSARATLCLAKHPTERSDDELHLLRVCVKMIYICLICLF